MDAKSVVATRTMLHGDAWRVANTHHVEKCSKNVRKSLTKNGEASFSGTPGTPSAWPRVRRKPNNHTAVADTTYYNDLKLITRVK